MENVITLGKLIGLLLFCPPRLSILFFENSKNTRNELTLPVMGTIFLVRTLFISRVYQRTKAFKQLLVGSVEAIKYSETSLKGNIKVVDAYRASF